MNGENKKVVKLLTYPKSIQFVLLIYLIGFSVGTSTHLLDVINGGFLPYHSAPMWKNVYWTSLLFFDFLTIVLLLATVKYGLVLANIVMISDVLINTSLFTHIGHYTTYMQVGFGLFVVLTTPYVFTKTRIT